MPRSRWMVLLLIIVSLLLIWAWEWIAQVLSQLLWGALTAMAALPTAKRLERRVSSNAAAAVSVGSLILLLLSFFLLLVPPLAMQIRQLAGMIPPMRQTAMDFAQQAKDWMEAHHLMLSPDLQGMIVQRGQQVLTHGAAAAASWLGSTAGSIGRWFLTPAFAFYFVRDRKAIGIWLQSLLPLVAREPAAWLVREIRRETAGYLRGQLMVSAAVGVMTAAGLLLCGVPSWLALGMLMGALEMLPYLGPVIGGGMVVLFALPGGLTRTLWALGVVLVVQQLEGTLLSPRLVSAATRIHPLAVLVCVMLGGAAAGIKGILLSMPLFLCARASLRVIGLLRIQRQQL